MMGTNFSALEATQNWLAFVDILSEHHFDARAEFTQCACGTTVRSRREFAQHQVIQLVLAGVLPRTYELQWALIRNGGPPLVMPFSKVIREVNRRPIGTARSACRSIYPPGPWIEDLRSQP